MSAPGTASGSYPTVEQAYEALGKQGFKKLKPRLYRVLRDQVMFDARIEVKEKKVIVHVTKSEGKS